jgi:hypothetical protein
MLNNQYFGGEDKKRRKKIFHQAIPSSKNRASLPNLRPKSYSPPLARTLRLRLDRGNRSSFPFEPGTELHART